MAFPPFSSSSLPPQFPQKDDINGFYHDRKFAINGEILMLILVLLFSAFLLFLIFIVWIKRDPTSSVLSSPEAGPTLDFPSHMFKVDQAQQSGRDAHQTV